MKWRLDADHHIDEMVLPAGTVIGDETRWPYRAVRPDKKMKSKDGKDMPIEVGDPLPPSSNMFPLDDEARRYWDKFWGDARDPGGNPDPTATIPLTGAENAPKVAGSAARDPAARPSPEAPHKAPDPEPKTGINAPNPDPGNVSMTKGGDPVHKPAPGPAVNPNAPKK